MLPPDSPEITIRHKAAPDPIFAGLSLPSALRELRAAKAENAKAAAEADRTPLPSEMTALALRLRKIRLDVSPEDDSPDKPFAESGVKPSRLDFSLQDDVGKENIDETTGKISSGSLSRKTPIKADSGKRYGLTEESEEVVGLHAKSLQGLAPAARFGETPVRNGDDPVIDTASIIKRANEEDSKDSPKDDLPSSENQSGGLAQDDESLQIESNPLQSASNDAQVEKLKPLDTIYTSSDSASVRAENDDEPCVEITGEGILHSQLRESSSLSNIEQDQERERDTEAKHFLNNSLQEMIDREREGLVDGGIQPDTESGIVEMASSHASVDEEQVADVPTKPVENFSRTSCNPESAPPEPESFIEQPDSPVAPSHDEEDSDYKQDEQNIMSSRPQEALLTVEDLENFKAYGTTREYSQGNEEGPAAENSRIEIVRNNLQKILQGKDKWAWPERCEAMASISQILLEHCSEGVVSEVRKVIGNLSERVNDHLDELRPSVISSALGLVGAITSSNSAEGSEFINDVFPSVMDIACGRSLTAQDAAKTVSICIEHYPSVASILADADNPDRLCEILEEQSACTSLSDEMRSRAANTIAIVRKWSENGANSTLPPTPLKTSGPMAHEQDDTSHLSSHIPANKYSNSERKFGGKISTVDEPKEPSATPQRSRLLSHSPNSRLARSSIRSSWRATLSTPMRKLQSEEEIQASDSSPSSAEGSNSSRNGGLVIRNKKLGDNVRKISPNSLRKRRMYTEDEMEESRRATMQVVLEKASQSHEKERHMLLSEKEVLNEALKKEQSEVMELRAVLEEYELTMQKMVSQGNSQTSAVHIALEAQNDKLKVELLEASEAFEGLKGKYESAKETITVYEKKENRFIEQIKDLKRNMVELQRWSNDLKANTEKKLTKAFDSVTTYRASYMDKEAYANKAICDLERTQSELEKAQQSNAEMAAEVGRIEVELRTEQDARSSAEASLTTAKASLSRVTSQKDRSQKELASASEALDTATAKITELQNAASRASEAQKQLDTYTSERQSLKARAYDDMTRIRELEAELDGKDKELEEMSNICEEAMSQLEQAKLG